MTITDAMYRDYRVAFLRYLPRREEAPLRTAYEIGRSAVVAGITILELVELHNLVFLELIRETAPDEVVPNAVAASEFLLEVLATYDMTQRALLDQAGPGGDEPLAAVNVAAGWKQKNPGNPRLQLPRLDSNQ